VNRSAQFGYLLLVLSVLCNGVRYHIDKAALRHCSAADLVFLAGLMATAGFFIGARLLRASGYSVLGWENMTTRSFLQAARQNSRLVLLAGLAGGAGAMLLTQTIKDFGPNPAAFLANLTPVFLVAAGLLIGERIFPRETAAVVIILAGALLFSYYPGGILWPAVGLMSLSCLCTSAKQLAVKQSAANGSLFEIMAAVQLLLSFWGGGVGLITGKLSIPPPHVWLLLASGAILGSIIGMSMLYAAYNIVGVSRGATVDAMRPVVVLLAGLLLGAKLPMWWQLIGGAMVVIGSATLGALAKPRPMKNPSPQFQLTQPATRPSTPHTPVAAAPHRS
jgi:drug/metabolite transporter (DMT)-like permease